MIILRQKTYSDLTPEERLFHVRNHGYKALSLTSKKVGKELKNTYQAFKKSMREVPLVVKNASPEERLAAEMKTSMGFNNKTPQQLMREAVVDGSRLKRKIGVKAEKAKRVLTTKEGAAKAAVKASRKVEKVLKQTPGDLVANVGETLVENPIGSIGTGVGNGIMLTGIVIPGTTEASWALEGALKNSSQGYKKVTKKAGNFYRKHFKDRVKGMADGVIMSLPK